MLTQSAPRMTLPDAAPGRRLPPPKTGTPKPVRHRRWRRAALAATALALVGFGVLTVSFLRKQGGDEGVSSTQHGMSGIARALGDYRAHNGRLPDALSRIVDPRYNYEGDVVPEDAWRGMIEYRVLDAEKGTYRLRSLGRDRLPDTPDDIVWPLGTAWNDA
jgi:hypothetical protein